MCVVSAMIKNCIVNKNSVVVYVSVSGGNKVLKTKTWLFTVAY
jgi:hypothetical protein